MELAKLTLEIGRTVAIKKLKLTQENPLPLENLDKNIICADSLLTEWTEVNAIIGNPPFLGGKRLRTELGDEYVEKIYKTFPEVQGQPDFCIHWFRKAHEQKAERIGLVGTNSISQGQSRKASLDFIIANGGIIHDAVSTQEWSGEAAVHVSIVNWVREQQKQNYLDEKPVNFINSSLKNENDFTQAKRLKQNLNLSFEACQISGKGFIISEEKAKEWIKQDKKNKQVLKIMIDGAGIIDPNKKRDFVIDFNDLTIEKASDYKLPFEHVKTFVKPERDTNNEFSRKEKWWQFGRKRPAMRKAIENLQFYFAIPKVAKYTVFQKFDVSILPCEANMVVASDDYYILGVLNSKLHRDWVKAQCSTLKGDTRYTNTTCFETFPFINPCPTDIPLKGGQASVNLQSPPSKRAGGLNSKGASVREIMRELDEFRLAMMKEKNYGITKLYNEFFSEPASKLSKLHKALDEAICKVYGWKYDSNKNYNQELFELNQKLFRELTS